ncbi:hypothetical protein [Riemerella columbina]|uniref:hypothetical protein n=1 Tax=Riemerella columbina TaxID=103810 RepID=UPI00266EB6BF|nr:hypothetical protein [Riemerella columbina]WKS94864.1 hypothetical protein NYR17_07995 [Riemerella columbina]
MKKQLLLVGLLSFAFAAAQEGNVGINTPTPKATLDVVGAPTDTSKFDGIIAPRITGEQLRAKTYAAAQNGAVVYVTAADTAPAGQTVDVKATGYYYFDSVQDKWIAMSSTSKAPVDWHIWGNNGTDQKKNFVGTLDDNALAFRVNDVPSGIITQYDSANSRTYPSGGNVALGYNALPIAKDVDPKQLYNGVSIRQNVAIGEESMRDVNPTAPTTLLIQNTAVGNRTLMKLQDGGTNVAIGTKALGQVTKANGNIAIGTAVLEKATNPVFNIALGYRVAENMTSGQHNIFLKNYTLNDGTTAADTFKSGDSNIFLGRNSGEGLLNGSNNIAIGAASRLKDNTNGQLNIGNVIFGTGMGNATSTQIKRVGIATDSTTPATETLQVKGTARITDLPTNGAANAISTKPDGSLSTAKDQTFTATKTLVVDNNGVLGVVNSLPSKSSGLTLDKSYTIDTSSNTAKIDLSNINDPKDLYVINDITTQGTYSTNITLPPNQSNDNTARVIKFYIVRGNGFGSSSGAVYFSNVSNKDIRSTKGYSITNGKVMFGNNSASRWETIITFVEFNNQWYLDFNNHQ